MPGFIADPRTSRPGRAFPAAQLLYPGKWLL